MRKSSTGRRSSSNPVRVSILEREEKSRLDARRTQIMKSKAPIQVDSSQIPRLRIRSSSNERASIRRSNLKPVGKTPLRQTQFSSHAVRVSNVATPLHTSATPRVTSNRLHPELPSGNRHRSPSAERASGFGSKGPRKDNRPLTDKAYQVFMLNKIDQYFYEIQQACLLNTNGSLRPVTLKIFVEATNCLVKLLDIKQDLTIANYTDEVPKIAKKLHYPGVVAKSWLKTANTMHSWPHVLGWLSWLAEVCDAKDKAMSAFVIDKIPFLEDDYGEDRKRCNFLAMLKIYRAWNDEKLEEEAALFEKRVQELMEETTGIDKDVDEEQLLNKEKASLSVADQQEAEIEEEMTKVSQILEGLKHEEYTDVENINAAEENVKRVILEMKHLDAECPNLEKKIERDCLHHEEMVRLVENQKMSVEKRKEIEREAKEIQDCIHQYDNHIKEIENELYALDLKFASSNHNLYKAILAYNKDIIMLLGADTGTDLEALKMPETNLLSPDIMDVLKTKEVAMLNLRDHIKKQFGQTESAIDANSTEMDSLEGKLKALRKENNNYLAKAHEQKLSIQQIQRHAKETETKLKQQIEHIQNDILQLQRSMPDVETAANELAEAQDKFEAVVRRSDFAQKRMEQFFNPFYQTLAYHRNDLMTILKNVPPGIRHEKSFASHN